MKVKFDYIQDICFILGNESISFFILKDETIRVANISLDEVLNKLELGNYYLKINRSIIINTLYFVCISSKKHRLILMKTGNILKVSRKYWNNFK